MNEVYLSGKRVRLGAQLGVGGEAEVYAAERDLAIKIWKLPEHPDYDGLPDQQDVARRRIEAHRRSPLRTQGALPEEIRMPLAPALDDKGLLVGYAMKRVENAEPLARFSDPASRKQRSANDVFAIFRRLHELVVAIHAERHTIGDFNDLNVLVSGTTPYLIDTDSWISGGYTVVAFTERFTDPMLGSWNKTGPYRCPAAPSDWYAFAALLFQSLLAVGPWGGVKPGTTTRQRIDQRTWVLDPSVRYPRAAIDPRLLPDAVRTELHAILCREQRTFDPSLLTTRFTRCLSCGLEHAQRTCPACTVVVPIVSVRGNVSSRTLFTTDGVIVCAALHGDDLHVVHYLDGTYRSDRELRAPLDARRRWAWQGSRALSGIGRALEGTSIDTDGQGPAFAANARHRYWCANGQLFRDGALGNELIGDVLEGATRLFVGEHFGLGLYRAGARTVAFLFDAERRGINDSLVLPKLPGQVTNVRAYFDVERVWLLVAHVFGGITEHHALVYDRTGALIARACERADASTWLSMLSGKVAVGNALLCATDEGLVRVECERGAIVRTREFPDTAPFVDGSCELLAGSAGLYVVSSRRVAALSIT